MKDFRGMKRQRSRSNRKPAGNSNNPNRAYESNGPEGTKARGNAQTIYEKYQQLARDANSAGDRVLAENHLQHAEHYFRMIRQMQPTRPVSEFVQRDPFSSGFDDDYDDLDTEAGEQEAEQVQSDEQPSDEPRYENRMSGERERNNDRANGERNNRQNGDRQNNDRNRNFKDRDGREPRGEFRQNDRNNGERNNEPRSFEPRNNNAPRDNAPRDSEPQFDENGNRRETRRERYERRRQQRFAEQEQNLNAPASFSAPAAETYVAPAFIASTQPLGAKPAAQTDLGFEAPAAEAPVVKEKRERPERKPRADTSNDAAQLPAFLHRPTPVAAEAPAAPEAEAKPKRVRKKKEDASASEEA